MSQSIVNYSNGQLYVIATPIGNLNDISSRALDCLSKCDLIAAEDTRHTKKLLNHFGIKKPMVSLHNFNEDKQALNIIEKLKSGQTVSMVSDAGTPLISDPGFFLVSLAVKEGIRITPIPGACALITALQGAGLACNEFFFVGFLPAKSSSRKVVLSKFLESSYLSIFYESPHRILDSLRDFKEIFGEKREIVLAKELTKVYETFFRGDIGSALNWLQEDLNHQRGEFVIVLSGVKLPPQEMCRVSVEQLLTEFLSVTSVKNSAKIVSKITGEKKNKVYELALKLSS